jgi:hypothetical protein
MDALGNVYPQYWLQPQAEVLIEGHFPVIKAHYCFERHGEDDVISPSILSLSKLNHECSQCKGAIKANAADAIQKPITLSPLTKLWRTLSLFCVLKGYFGEWFKVAEIVAVQVLGSVEDKRTFSIVSFSKNQLRNCFSEHLNTIVGVFSQNFYTMENFFTAKPTTIGKLIRSNSLIARFNFFNIQF